MHLPASGLLRPFSTITLLPACAPGPAADRCLFYSSIRETILVKIALVAVRPKQQTFGPGWCPAHLLTRGGKGNPAVALDDKLIMDMGHDGAVPQRLYGVHEDVPGGSLDAIAHDTDFS